MMCFPMIERPLRTRRKETLDYDRDLEAALRQTLSTGMAIAVPLGRFHSSPAKMRLWKEGLRLRHRVLQDRQSVAAWVEREEPAVPAAVAVYEGRLF